MDKNSRDQVEGYRPVVRATAMLMQVRSQWKSAVSLDTTRYNKFR